MQLTDYPLIIVKSGNKSLNFLIDTGSNFSTIDSKALEGTEYKKLEDNWLYATNNGLDYSSACSLHITIGKLDTWADISCSDMSDVFGIIKQESGVNIHGILGTDFLDKNNFMIDFKDYIITSK